MSVMSRTRKELTNPQKFFRTRSKLTRELQLHGQ